MEGVIGDALRAIPEAGSSYPRATELKT